MRAWRHLLALIGFVAFQVPACAEDEPPPSPSCGGLADCFLCACGSSDCIETLPVIATSCSPPSGQTSPPPDECACEGRVCSDGASSVRVFHPPPSALGGPGSVGNICTELCSGDADCGVGRACRRDLHGLKVCATPSCASDADCTADPCGHCVPGIVYIHGGHLLDSTRAECVYEGPCAGHTCATCWRDARSASDTPHRCGM